VRPGTIVRAIDYENVPRDKAVDVELSPEVDRHLGALAQVAPVRRRPR